MGNIENLLEEAACAALKEAMKMAPGEEKQEAIKAASILYDKYLEQSRFYLEEEKANRESEMADTERKRKDKKDKMDAIIGYGGLALSGLGFLASVLEFIGILNYESGHPLGSKVWNPIINRIFRK